MQPSEVSEVGPVGALRHYMERHIEWQWAALQTATQKHEQGHRRKRRQAHGRRWVVGIATIVATLCVAGLVGRSMLEGHIRNEVVPTLAERLGRDVEVGEIVFGFGTATLRDITVRGPRDAVKAVPMAAVRQATVTIDLPSLLRGDVVVEHVDLTGVSGNIVIGAGDDNVSDVLARLSAASPSQPQAGAKLQSSSKKATLHASDVVLNITERGSDSNALLSASSLEVDAARVVKMSGVDLSATTKLRGQVASIELVSATVRATRDGSISLNAGGMRTASSDPRLQTVLAENSVGKLYAERVRGQNRTWEWHFMGDFTSIDERLENDVAESFLVSLSKAASGKDEIRVQGKNLQLSRFAPLLAAYPELGLENARASVEWTVLADRNSVSVQGNTVLDGLRVEHPRLAKGAMYVEQTTLKGRASLDRQTGTLRIDDATVLSGDVPYELSLGFLLPGFDREEHPASRLTAWVAMPKVPCQAMLSSLPRGFAPELEGFSLAGNAQGQLTVSIDWDDLDATELDSDINFNECRVLSAPYHMSAERLTGSFEHRVPVPGGWRTFVVGPENPDFVPLRKVSKNLTRSFLTTEDSAFYRHSGFIAKEFQSALVKNLERGRFAYGASSISMQVVKNVLLSREKTVSRKVQELFLTWHMESILSKDRILEIYVNAIEFGPGLYGIGPAARQYFSKHPRNLNPVESAFLSSLLPAPTKRFRQYCRGYVGRTTSAKIERILGHMHKRHRLDEEAHALALETPLSFRGRKSSLCKRRHPSKKGKNS